ncbi:MAG TPA: hypothetical protein EYQ50_29150 [Verrucomicrobiales bacterium]|nr:hypothetical protein [Verrucomicrobiales bacterium]
MNRPVSSMIKFSEEIAPLRTNFWVLTFYESEDMFIRHVGLEVMTLREAIQCRQHAGSLLREGLGEGDPSLKSLGLQTTEAGKPSGRKRRRNILGFHSLRYSFATIQRTQGVDPHVVKQMAGHTEIEMTDRYTSVGITEKKNSIGLLPDFTD